MKKLICKVWYDTENATVVKKNAVGNFGDAEGYEETLYVTADGKYFLYTNGGEESKYSEENIKRMSKKAADKWIEEN